MSIVRVRTALLLAAKYRQSSFIAGELPVLLFSIAFAYIELISAGIGRTGTFITVYNTVRRYHELLLRERTLPPPINVVQTVLALRRQRPGMVQTKEQFMFCYIGALMSLFACHIHDSFTQPSNNGSTKRFMLRLTSLASLHRRLISSS